jgi:hypothetical protein
VFTVLSWVVTLPVLARLMRWRRQTALWVQNVFGPLGGLVWGRIGWLGVRHHGFSNEDAFLAGGLAGIIAPSMELTLRRLRVLPAVDTAEPDLRWPPWIVYPFAWFWGFLVGGLLATLGAVVARLGRD